MRRCFTGDAVLPSRGRMEEGAVQLAAWLCEALRGERDTAVEDLLQRGADPNLVLPEGVAPIHLAAGTEQESGIRCLGLILQHGGDPNARSVDDLTPLHVAASWGCYTCLRLLLMEGGDPHLEDQDGNTALDLALEQGNELCVRILQEALDAKEGEQSSWMSHRRAESFLSTVTEDTVEAGGISRPSGPYPNLFIRSSKSSPNAGLGHSVFPHPLAAAPAGDPNGGASVNRQDKTCSCGDQLSASFLTEFSWKGTTLCDHCEFPTQLAASAGGKQTSNCSAVEVLPKDKRLMLASPELDACGRAAPSCLLKTTTGEGCPSAPAQNDVLPKVSSINPESWVAGVNPEILSTIGSREILAPALRDAMKSESEIDHFPGTQDANTTLDLTEYGSFFNPDLVVKLSGRQGLDVTSPDHVYLFSQGNSTTVSDLEKTLVVNPAFLSKDGWRARAESFRRSSDDVGSRYLSCECDANTSEEAGWGEAQRCQEREASVGGSPGSSGGSQRQSSLSQTSDDPRGSKKRVTASPVAATIPAPPSKSQTLGHSQAGPDDLGETRQQTLGLCSTGKTQDTVPTRRTSEDTGAFLDGETPVSLGTSEDAGDTVPVPRQLASVVEEELSSLDTKLRSMMLATKACHSPLLQPKWGSRHTPACSKSLTATSAARHDDSGSASLFDEAPEMPRRPRRVRSPEGRAPVCKEACGWPIGPRNESLPCGGGEERGRLGGTQLVSPGPSSHEPHGGPGSIPLGPAGADQSGRDYCRGQHQGEGKAGSRRSADSEVKPSPKAVKPPPDNTEEPDASSGEADAAPPRTGAQQPAARRGKGERSPKPTRVSFSRLSAQGPSCVPGAASRPSGKLSPVRQVVPLSPGGRPVNVSVTEPVEYLYVDEDEGHTLVERHVPCADDSIAGTTGSEDTVIYDWRAYANRPANKGKGSPEGPLEVYGGRLTDDALVQKLRDLGVNPGPVTGLTRKLYVQLLERLMSDPKTKARKDSAGYSPELSFSLETYQIPDGKDDEVALARQFDRPDKSKKWREGLLKSSFNYLLLDPRVTQNLPFRCQYVSQAECFRTFVSAIFYVGKGKRSRPYSHLYEALTHYRGGRGKRGGQACPKVQHILEIWASGQGVVSMHCFQNVIPVEAYTREACMVDAIGLKMLTNQKRGDYYGLVAGWPMKRRRCLGAYLLHRAMQIFLAEGERQLRPADIQPGR